MTTYTLTDKIDTISAGNGTDFFQGPGGGIDSLRGNGGSDFFSIQIGQTGLIDGGAGFDRIHLTGPGFNNEFDAGLKITGVEELIVDTTNIFTTVAQLKGFTHIGLNNESDSFSVFLQGAGGGLNFSSSFTDPQDLNIEAVMATSAVQIVGSAGDGEIIGSDFGDNLNGHNGRDTVRGGDGNDLVNGGAGRDFLFGDDGKDSFLFNTLTPGEYDHLGDFRPDDDSIRLDDAVFTAFAGRSGTILPGHFRSNTTGLAQDASDHIIYNQDNGVIYYDEDGIGGKARIAFAVADNFAGDIPVLTFQDFIIV
jgi:Ca2+-binding RTX toxin-like protein